MFLTIFTIFITFLSSIILLSRRKFNYWRNKNVPHLSPKLLFGNYADFILQRRSMAEITKTICDHLPDAPMVGAYLGTEPVLIIQNPDLIRVITSKDFYYFSSRDNSEFTHKETITQNLFFTYGDRWKVLRQNLTPMFTPSKMKNMFHLIEKCTRKFDETLKAETAESTVLNVNTLMARFTMDCICSCTFGVNTRAMDKDTDNNPFYKIAESIFHRSSYGAFKEQLRSIWPGIFYGIRLKLFPDQIINFFRTIVLNVMKERDWKPSARQDFLDLLIEMKSQGFIEGDSIESYRDKSLEKIKLKADDDLIIGHSQELFATGFETSANTLAFTLYELAKDQQAQNKAFEEVDKYFQSHDALLFDSCSELVFLKQCVEETLRLYPVLGVIYRQVSENYKLQGVPLERGLRVHIPVYHMHRNPKYFDSPDDFRPERFSSEERSKILPYTYLPFGEGPRFCLGTRFAWMQVLAGLATVLRSYHLELADDMSRSITLHPKSLLSVPLGGIRLKLIAREN